MLQSYEQYFFTEYTHSLAFGILVLPLKRNGLPMCKSLCLQDRYIKLHKALHGTITSF